MAILVYKLTCSISGKSYVGITSRALDTRWLEHCGRARQGVRQSRLYDAVRKYGPDAFSRAVIATADTEDEARSLERAFIQNLRTCEDGYNANEGGCGWLHVPESVRRKSSETQKGKVISSECRAKMSAAKKGDKAQPDHLGAHLGKGAANPRASLIAVSCPDGVLRIQRGLRAFVREHGLSMRHLKSRGHSKGYHLLDRTNHADDSASELN